MSNAVSQNQESMRAKLAKANINPESFLATDYLNHFNEIVMLLEMVPDMPDLLEEAEQWSPKSYSEHFKESGFEDKALAVEAYNIAPAAIRTAFERQIATLDNSIQGTVRVLTRLDVPERGLSLDAQKAIRARIRTIQDQLMELNGIIHGHINSANTANASEDAQTQEDIDRLFP